MSLFGKKLTKLEYYKKEEDSDELVVDFKELLLNIHPQNSFNKQFIKNVFKKQNRKIIMRRKFLVA